MKYDEKRSSRGAQNGRAPQGARGLKLMLTKPAISTLIVAPRKGRVG